MSFVNEKQKSPRITVRHQLRFFGYRIDGLKTVNSTYNKPLELEKLEKLRALESDMLNLLLENKISGPKRKPRGELEGAKDISECVR